MGSKFMIDDIEVYFPYEKPYDLQKKYMEQVMNCLKNRKHGVLESPTGTGKTLCLFAPLTAWLKKKKNTDRTQGANTDTWLNQREKVWYTARTHSQIAQTIGEVRRLDIGNLAIRVMGAREQLCVNPEVLQEKEPYVKAIKCKELIKAKMCRFHRALDYDKYAPTFFRPGEIADIEDLVSTGKNCGVCPYYMATISKESADVILLPYNYIIDRDSRDNTANYKGDIVIFDEGHNVPNTCEESFEFTLTTADIAMAIKNTQELMESLLKLSELAPEEEIDFQSHCTNSALIKEIFLNLEQHFNSVQVSDTQYPLKDLRVFFETAGLTGEKLPVLQSAIENFIADSMKLTLTGPMLKTLTDLEKILTVMYGDAIKSFDKELVEKSFKFVFSEDSQYKQFKSKKLSLFCFNPSFGIKDILLLGVQSLIITSGTLSPLPSLIHELSLPNPVTLENIHIARSSQVPFIILGTGVNNVRMDASFKNRKDRAYMSSLGMTLTNLIGSIPDGVLLLFSSYSMMQDLQMAWEADDRIWKRLNNIKRVFIEPRGKEEFINCMENYRRAVDAGNGAILMGVVRGKISEGMDFKDHYCRGVFIVGVPFPPVMDPRVKGKEKYSEALTIKNPVTNKMEKLYTSFLSVEAMKATNQAIGRVIRHVQDYGAIVLVDYRFVNSNLFSNISKWIRCNNAPSSVNFMAAKKTLREFFQQIHLGTMDVPEIRKQLVNSSGDPIACNIKYEEYNHAIAMRRHVPRGPSSYINPKVKPSSVLYDDNFASSSSEYWERINQIASENDSSREINSPTSSKAIKTLRIENSPNSMKSESSLKTKTYKDSPYSSPRNVNNQKSKLAFRTYFMEVREHLNSHEFAEFKTSLAKYVKEKGPFEDLIPVLNKCFVCKKLDKLLNEFHITVKPEDKTKWDNFLAAIKTS